jgi:solute carrier family 25 iron transporter 28/37
MSDVLANNNLNNNYDSSAFEDVDEDWEAWDGRSPFWVHCVAGSLAGVVEHTAIYPLDTVRTHIQVCAGCIWKQSPSSSASGVANEANNAISQKFLETGSSSSSNWLVRSTVANNSAAQQRLPLGMWQTIRHLMSEPVVMASVEQAATISSSSSTPGPNLVAGWTRLFRGVQTILIGCIPAHALYFSSYEAVKAIFSNGMVGTSDGGIFGTVGQDSLAGAAAVMAHDIVMTPLDTLKQRMQLGHYSGVAQAYLQVTRHEGKIALYRSFPITLASNIPYGMIMVSTHEACKHRFREACPERTPAWQIVLAASSVAGLVASAITTPLDRVKTALQTQQLVPVCSAFPNQQQHSSSSLATTKSAHAALPPYCPRNNMVMHANWREAAQFIWKTEGPAGFFRGLTPRVLSHTPAVAISWTTYETAKQYILSHHHHYS